MATSGSTDFSVNRDQLITGALRIVGAIATGETPSTSMISEASEALNMLVKAWQADGMPLWAIKQYAVPLTASQATYTIGVGQEINTPKPLRVVQAFLNNPTSNIDVPMVLLTRDEYNFLGNKTSEGEPIQFFYEPLLDYGILHLFPVPDTVTADDGYTVTLVYQRPYEDFDSAADTPDFPQEWYDALKFGLADRLSIEYGCSIEDRNSIKGAATQLKDDALSMGTEEGGFYFQMDNRAW